MTHSRISIFFLLFSSCLISQQSTANTITLNNQVLALSISATNNWGLFGEVPEFEFNPRLAELTGNKLLVKPNYTVGLPAELSIVNQTRFALINFNVYVDAKAKPGYQIDGYTINAFGNMQVGDGSRVLMTGSFNAASETFGSGPWFSSGTATSTSPYLTLGVNLLLLSEPHYAGQAPSGNYYDEPIYETQETFEIVGYEPVFDENGNFIDQTPIYEPRYQDVLVGYNSVEILNNLYQNNEVIFSIEGISVDYEVSAVPLPSSGLLLVGGLSMLGMLRKRRTKFPKSALHASL